ncbi:unnamed protein product [Bemisia tabaci]|uniref:Ionotropic receptor n=1 Tax=Bemisia tabaci TaxID=7038 RepID=A0A9P0A3Z8_BEMTA|nr:unnamed protein product [Bemisia tabaci]
MSLVLYTVTKPSLLEENAKNTKSLETESMRTENQSKGILPLYCVTMDGRALWTLGDITCSEELRLSSADLEPNSILSNRVFHATRGLYINKIWNSKNYLIFMLKKFDPIHRHPAYTALLRTGNGMKKYSVDLDPVARLVFCLKFFWRFFRGLKAVICHSHGCERYDPFTEKLISTEGGTDQNCFDFSWSDMHTKSVSTMFPDKDSHYLVSSLGSPTGAWINLLTDILNDFKRSVNCTLKINHGYELFEDRFRPFDPEFGLKYDVDMQPFEFGLSLEGFNYSQYDFSVSVDTRSLCFATPHSSFMPQGLVIFESFSPPVWTLILITFISFCIILDGFHYLQCKVFYFLYSEAEIEYYRSSPSLLTVYAFFMCGSPANLRLGHLLTGKALFVIFSFSAFIITNAFLGCMTTLLSKRVLYPELDSLKALEESDLLIQTALYTADSGKEMFYQQNLSEMLSAKLVDNLYHYYWKAFEELALNDFGFYDGHVSSAHYNFTKNRIGAIEQNTLSMAAMDAVMVSVPFSSNRKENLCLKNAFQVEIEYHMMQECLITYPLMIPFLKNSFLYEKLNRIIYQNMETGHTKIISEGFDIDFREFSSEGTHAEDAEPKPYDLNDLQSAFIGLIVGLLVSFLFFIAEVFTNLYPNAIIIRNLWKLKISCWQKLRIDRVLSKL